MKLLAWLRALLRRPAPSPSPGPLYQQPLAPAQQATNHSLPLVPVPPPTSALRLARTQARAADIAQAVATSQAKATSPLPAELYRLDIELQYLRFDLVEAQGMGWVADELHLNLELQRVAAELQLRAWQHSLIERFGPAVGTKLSQHEVEVGMRWEHVVCCYGPPLPEAVTLLAKHPLHLAVRYGSKATGSYFEVVDNVVTVARLGLPTVPAHLLELCA